MERLVQFSLYGQNFSFYSEADEDEIEKIVAIVQAEVESHGQTLRGKVLSSKLAVLASLRIAAQYVELEKEFNAYREEQDAHIRHIVKTLLPVINGNNT